MDRALSLNPRDVSAMNNRGYSYFLAKDPNKAMADFNAALAINPNFADALHNRGNLNYSIGRADLACQDWLNAAKNGNKQSEQNLQKYCQ